MYTKNFSLSKSEASFAAGFESFYCKVVLGLALLFVIAGCDSKTASNIEPTSGPIPANADTKPAKTKIEPATAPEPAKSAAPRKPSKVAPPQTTATTEQQSPAPKDVTKEDPPKQEVAEKPKEKEDPRLHKNFTTLVLAHEPDIRARHLLMFVRKILTEEQHALGVELLLEHDHRFQEIIRKRATILNNAVHGDDTPEQLKNIKQEAVDLSKELRQLVFRKILTPEQKKMRNRESELKKKEAEEARLAKQLKQEQKKNR